MLAARREAKWERHIWETYRLTAEDYWRIYEAQGGCCALCRRGKGLRKRLSVDHDHACCKTTPTCGRCTRGLLDTACNKLLGHFRDSADTFYRAADYLQNPPAREILSA